MASVTANSRDRTAASLVNASSTRVAANASPPCLEAEPALATRASSTSSRPTIDAPLTPRNCKALRAQSPGCTLAAAQSSSRSSAESNSKSRSTTASSPATSAATTATPQAARSATDKRRCHKAGRRRTIALY